MAREQPISRDLVARLAGLLGRPLHVSFVLVGEAAVGAVVRLAIAVAIAHARPPRCATTNV
eukprot:2113682-Pleurochrysis_carterae.AAC.2